MSSLRKRGPKPEPKVMQDLKDEDGHGHGKSRARPGKDTSFLVDTIKLAVFLMSFTLFALFLYNKAVTSWSTVTPPGTLIQLSDGHSVHLHCKGEPSERPMLLFAAGIASPGLYWFYEQNKLSEEGWYVCVYDRSGLAWSEHSPDRHVTVQAYVEELYEMIQRSPLGRHPAGYVLVGFSMGGAMVGRLVEQWPESPRGAYIVDPHFAPHPGLKYTLIETEFGKIRTALPVVKLLAELGFLRPLWSLGYLIPWTFDGMVPLEPLEPYLHLAAKPNGLYYGLIHELTILDPGHGHYSNASTWEFIQNYNKIPIFVELRGQGFSVQLPEGTNLEWVAARKELTKMVPSKHQLYMEDHYGRAYLHEPPSQFQARTLDRIRQFLSQHFLNQ